MLSTHTLSTGQYTAYHKHYVQPDARARRNNCLYD